MRLKTAEAYVKVLTGASGGEAMQRNVNHSIGLTGNVLGLGPAFKLRFKVYYLPGLLQLV